MTRPTGQSYAEYGHSLLPLETDRKRMRLRSSIIRTPGRRETLEAMKLGADPDPYHGWKLVYTNPLNGGHAMPTISTFMQLVPKAEHNYRSTDATVFTCVEERGR